MNFKLPFLALLMFAQTAISANREESFKEFWRPINQLEYSRVSFEFILYDSDYSSSENMEFRLKDRSFQVCTVDYRKVHAPIEVYQQTTYIHPLKEIESRENLNDFYFMFLKYGFSDEETFLRAIITVKWTNKEKEASFGLNLSSEGYSQLMDFRRKLVKDYHLFSQQK